MKDKFKQSRDPANPDRRVNPPSKHPLKIEFSILDVAIITCLAIIIIMSIGFYLQVQDDDRRQDLHTDISILELKLDAAMLEAVKSSAKLSFCQCEVKFKLLGLDPADNCHYLPPGDHI